MTSMISKSTLVKAYCFYLVGSASTTAVASLFLLKYLSYDAGRWWFWMSMITSSCGIAGVISVWLFTAVWHSVLRKQDIAQPPFYKMYNAWFVFRLLLLFYCVIVGGIICGADELLRFVRHAEFFVPPGFWTVAGLAGFGVLECLAFSQVIRHWSVMKEPQAIPEFSHAKIQWRGVAAAIDEPALAIDESAPAIDEPALAIDLSAAASILISPKLEERA